jgi:hypothetical protein
MLATLTARVSLAEKFRTFSRATIRWLPFHYGIGQVAHNVASGIGAQHGSVAAVFIRTPRSYGYWRGLHILEDRKECEMASSPQHQGGEKGAQSGSK